MPKKISFWLIIRIILLIFAIYGIFMTVTMTWINHNALTLTINLGLKYLADLLLYFILFQFFLYRWENLKSAWYACLFSIPLSIYIIKFESFSVSNITHLIGVSAIFIYISKLLYGCNFPPVISILHLLKPQNESITIKKARILYQGAKYKSCIDLLNRKDIDRVKFNEADFLEGLGYYGLKEYDRSIKFLKPFVLANNTNALAFRILGICNYKLQDFKLAVYYCSAAIKLNPDNQIALFYRALSYYEMNEYHKSIKDNERILELNPEYSTVYYNLGINFQMLGEIDKALELWEKSITLSKQEPLGYLAIGNDYYHRLNDIDKAVGNYLKAIALDSNIWDYIPEELLERVKGFELENL